MVACAVISAGQGTAEEGEGDVPKFAVSFSNILNNESSTRLYDLLMNSQLGDEH